MIDFKKPHSQVHERDNALSRADAGMEADRRLQIAELEGSFNKNKEEWLRAKLLELAERGAIKTGFETLDGPGFLDGGLYPGLYVIAGDSSVGKTTLALQMADQIAASGTDVIFFTLETPEIELMAKSISRYTLKGLLESGEVAPGQKPDRRAKSPNDIYNNRARDGIISSALDRYLSDTGKRLRIIEGEGAVGVEDISAAAREHIELTGRRPVVFLDCLQTLARPRGMSQGMSEQQALQANILKLGWISRDLETPVVGISGPIRDDCDTPMSEGSLDESWGTEYPCHVLIELEPSRVGDQGDDAKAGEVPRGRETGGTGVRSSRLVVLKNRHGRTGGFVPLGYYPAFNLFYEREVARL